MFNPIKILHVMPHIATGGAERQLYELIVHSDPNRMQHEVLYYSDSQDKECYALYDQGGVKYSRIPRNKFLPVRFLMDFARQIRLRKPDVVHCWLESANFWGRLAALLAGVKPVITAWRNCSLVRLSGMRVCEHLTSGRVSHLANSRACAEYIAKRLWISPSRFTVVYNGLDVARFDLPDKRNELFGHLRIPEGYKIVTMVGRLAEQKNYPMLIRTAQKTKEKGLPLHYLIAGTGSLSDHLVSLSRHLQVEDRVHFLGVRRDVPQILASSDIFLFTTNFEGFPNALLESMAARLPIVTTAFAGSEELIENNHSGLIVPMDDENAAVEALSKYVNDPQAAKEFGSNARKFVESSVSMEKMVEETEKLYRRLLTKA